MEKKGDIKFNAGEKGIIESFGRLFKNIKLVEPV
jgi:hypothetical protein